MGSDCWHHCRIGGENELCCSLSALVKKKRKKEAVLNSLGFCFRVWYLLVFDFSAFSELEERLQGCHGFHPPLAPGAFEDWGQTVCTGPAGAFTPGAAWRPTHGRPSSKSSMAAEWHQCVWT